MGIIVRRAACLACAVAVGFLLIGPSCTKQPPPRGPASAAEAPSEEGDEETAPEALWRDRDDEQSLRAAIAAYEDQLQQGASVQLCTRLARAYYLLADVLLRGQGGEAIEAFKRGAAVGMEGMRLNEQFRRSVEEGEPLHQAIALIGGEQIGPLLWWGANRGRWLSYQDLLTQWVHRREMVAVMERVEELDERHFYGGVHRMWAVYHVRKGAWEQAEASFERALQIAPFFLMTRRMWALECAVPKEDRELFVEQLTLALRTPEPDLPDVLPEFRLERAWAAELLARVDEFFPD